MSDDDEDHESEFESAESADEDDPSLQRCGFNSSGLVTPATGANLSHTKGEKSDQLSRELGAIAEPSLVDKDNDFKSGNKHVISPPLDSSPSIEESTLLKLPAVTKLITSEQSQSAKILAGSATTTSKVMDGWGWEVDDDEGDILTEIETRERDEEVTKVDDENSAQKSSFIQETSSTCRLSSGQTSIENLIVDDHKLPTSALDKLSNASSGEKDSLWGWSSWGASVLSTASSSVATFTTQFEQGLNTVLETVESSLGAPSPEELASRHHQNHEKSGDPHANEANDNTNVVESVQKEANQSSDLNIMESLVSGVSSSFTNVLENKVISGGLDTLELIGRKTMDILQEGDPGLKKKRAFLERNRPCLSEVLREAKEKHGQYCRSDNADNSKIRINFGTIFDDHQGFVHLEALEMLSKQIEQKVQLTLLNLTGDELCDVQSELRLIENQCVLDIVEDEEDVDVSQAETADIGHFADKMSENFEKFSIPVNLEKLTKVQVDGQTWLRDCQDHQDRRETSKDAEAIHDRAITFLAEFTAKAIEVLHKTSELMLVSESQDGNLQLLSGFVKECCTEVSGQTSRYSACLNTSADDSENPDVVTPLITNVFLEASNSQTYIQDAFRLVAPIFQLIFLNRTKEIE